MPYETLGKPGLPGKWRSEMRRGLRIGGVVILVAGACLTGRAAYMHAKAELAGVLIRRAWEESARSGEPRAPWPWADTRPVARLRIPRLGYDEIVLDDATPSVLAFGPALLLSGARPGKAGNVVVAGHRTSWFRWLEGIAEGDTMEMEWFDARRGGLYERRYKVEAIRIVEPSDVRLPGATGADALTLITCYPFGRGPRSPKRFVVRGVPMGASWRVGEERNSKSENRKSERQD